MIAWFVSLLLCVVAPGGPPDDPFARGYLGVTIDSSVPDVVAVGSVQADTPAQRAGLRGGDILVRVGSVEPKNYNDVVEHVKSFRPGTALRVEVRRPSLDGTPPKPLVMTVRLMARPESADLGLPVFPPK